MKVRPVGAGLYHADGRTDIKLIFAFAILGTRLKDMNSAKDSDSQARPWLFIHSDIHTALAK